MVYLLCSCACVKNSLGMLVHFMITLVNSITQNLLNITILMFVKVVNERHHFIASLTLLPARDVATALTLR